MARGKSGPSHCAFKSLCADQGGFASHDRYRQGWTWCGDVKLFSEADRAEPVKLADCPKCAQALGKAKLAKAGRVVLEQLEKPHSYDRSTYRVLIDGVHRGWIGTESGWGKGWYLRQLAENEGTDESRGYCYRRNVSGDRPSRYDAQRQAEAEAKPEFRDHHRRIFWPVHFAARDAMAAAALALHETGGLPTVAEMAERKEAERVRRVAEEAERAAMREEAAKRRAREEEEREERRTAAREALASLEGRPDLTNLELAGLAAIRTLLNMGVE
jgi:hypothetical protein